MNPANPPFRPIVLSDEELRSGNTSYDSIQAGIEEFHKNGFVILQNAIPAALVDMMNRKMQADALVKRQREDTMYNMGNTSVNYSFSPPLSRDWLIEDFWANKHAAAVMEGLIGLPQLVFSSCNVNMPTTRGTDVRQAVHSDSYDNHYDFPYCIEMFIYLEDVNEENGSTELWPGSHKKLKMKHQADHGRGWIKPEVFNKRARRHPPIQPTVPKGSVCMRDLRLWHAGMPNYSQHPRIMLFSLFFPRWYRNPMSLTLPLSSRFLLESWTQIDAISRTQFVPGDSLDNISGTGLMGILNFTQDPLTSIAAIRSAKDAEQGRPRLQMLRITENDYWTPGRDRVHRRRKLFSRWPLLLLTLILGLMIRREICTLAFFFTGKT